MTDLEQLARFGARAQVDRDLDALLDAGLALLMARVGASHALIVQPLRGSALLRVRAGQGWASAAAGDIVVEDGPFFRAALTRAAPTLSPGPPGSPALESIALFRAEGLRAGLTVALPGQDGALGALGLYMSRPHTFSADEVAFTRVVAASLAAAIARGAAEEGLLRSEQRLQTVQKMEAIGRLAGGIAHDFNNLVQAISGYTEMALHGLGPDDSLRHPLEEIKRAGDRAAALTRQLLAFSRQQVLQPRVLALNDVVARVEQLLRRLIGEDVRLCTALAPDLGAVRADAAQLEQVLMNLAVNARDAMPGGGVLTIETRNVTLPAPDQREAFIQPGPYVLLLVADSGCGMDPETRRRAFEPFFTTKPPGQGTGLGLSTVYGIVKQSGGYILVDSAPGAGTRVRIYLPRVNADPVEDPPDAVASAIPRGSGTLLLVEDEDGVRELVAEWLGSHGYRVLEAASGAEALEVARRHDGPIHLLVADVVMPGMGGPELASRLAADRPGMRVVYVSGYAEDATGDGRLTASGAAFVQKPFALDHLVRTIGRLLGGPADAGTRENAHE